MPCRPFSIVQIHRAERKSWRLHLKRRAQVRSSCCWLRNAPCEQLNGCAVRNHHSGSTSVAAQRSMTRASPPRAWPTGRRGGALCRRFLDDGDLNAHRSRRSGVGGHDAFGSRRRCGRAIRHGCFRWGRSRPRRRPPFAPRCREIHGNGLNAQQAQRRIYGREQHCHLRRGQQRRGRASRSAGSASRSAACRSQRSLPGPNAWAGGCVSQLDAG